MVPRADRVLTDTGSMQVLDSVNDSLSAAALKEQTTFTLWRIANRNALIVRFSISLLASFLSLVKEIFLHECNTICEVAPKQKSVLYEPMFAMARWSLTKNCNFIA